MLVLPKMLVISVQGITARPRDRETVQKWLSRDIINITDVSVAKIASDICSGTTIVVAIPDGQNFRQKLQALAVIKI